MIEESDELTTTTEYLSELVSEHPACITMGHDYTQQTLGDGSIDETRVYCRKCADTRTLVFEGEG
jgi:hypothetical protein